MSFWQMIGVIGTVTTILGLFLTLYSILHNKTLKAEFAATRQILDRIERGQEESRKEMAEAIKYVADLVRAEGERTREVIRPR